MARGGGDDSELLRGVTKGQKNFIRFLAVLGHSELILNFCKNDGDGGEGRGGGGPKFVYPEFTDTLSQCTIELSLAQCTIQ